MGRGLVLGFRVAAGEKDVIVDPIKIFHEAVENCKPSVATEIRKRGGKSYHVSMRCAFVHLEASCSVCKLLTN